MPVYLLFAGYRYDRGGAGDCLGVFPSIEDAIAACPETSSNETRSWANVYRVDPHKLTLVAEFSGHKWVISEVTT